MTAAVNSHPCDFFVLIFFSVTPSLVAFGKGNPLYTLQDPTNIADWNMDPD